MSPEATAGSNPPSFTHDERVILLNHGHNVLPDERFDHPEDQIEAWCDIAREDARVDGGLSRKILDTAVATADGMEEDDLAFPRHDGYYGPVTPFVSIVHAAHQTGQDPEYVRGVLDKAITKAGIDQQSPRPEIQLLQLSLLAEAAFQTGQDPDYIRRLVDRMREVGPEVTSPKPPENGVPTRIVQLQRLLELSGQVELGEEYQHGLFEEARNRWSPSAASSPEKIDAKAMELAVIASVAHKHGERPGYVYDIIEEGRKFANWGAEPDVFVELAERAQDIGQSEMYVGDILMEGLHAIGRRKEEQPARRTVDDIKDLVCTIPRPSTDFTELLQSQFLVHGLHFIGAAEGTARQKHMWLNALLKDMDLSKDFIANHGVERKPFNYAFKS